MLLYACMHNNSFWLSENDSYQFWVLFVHKCEMIYWANWDDTIMWSIISNTTGRWDRFEVLCWRHVLHVNLTSKPISNCAFIESCFRVEDNRQSINHILCKGRHNECYSQFEINFIISIARNSLVVSYEKFSLTDDRVSRVPRKITFTVTVSLILVTKAELHYLNSIFQISSRLWVTDFLALESTQFSFWLYAEHIHQAVGHGRHTKHHLVFAEIEKICP